MTNPHIHQTDTLWVVIARMHDGGRQLYCGWENDKPMAFPSTEAAAQHMKASLWTEEELAEIYFEPVEDDDEPA